ncbi:phosphopantetheine-binding protein [Streptomyces venezuelae ATCC 10712]
MADPREEILRGLFAEILDRDEVLPEDNFFKLGGHSLLAGKLTNRVRGALGLQAAIRDVFLAPTPGSCSAASTNAATDPGARPSGRCRPSTAPTRSPSRTPSAGSGSWAASKDRPRPTTPPWCSTWRPGPTRPSWRRPYGT